MRDCNVFTANIFRINRMVKRYYIQDYPESFRGNTETRTIASDFIWASIKSSLTRREKKKHVSMLMRAGGFLQVVNLNKVRKQFPMSVPNKFIWKLLIWWSFYVIFGPSSGLVRHRYAYIFSFFLAADTIQDGCLIFKQLEKKEKKSILCSHNQNITSTSTQYLK